MHPVSILTKMAGYYTNCLSNMILKHVWDTFIYLFFLSGCAPFKPREMYKNRHVNGLKNINMLV